MSLLFFGGIMAISVLCPTCGKTVTGSDKIAGKVVTCPGCRSDMQIPETVPPEPAPQAQADVELVPFDVDLVETPSTPTPTRSADTNRGGIGIGILIGLGSTVVVLLIGAVAVLAYLHFRGDGGAKQASDAKSVPKKKSEGKVRQEIFEPVYRVAVELKAGQDVGINREKFGGLLQKFASEISIAKDKAENSSEQRVCAGYSRLLETYKDAAKVWDVKIEVPRIKHEADKYYDQIGSVGGGDSLEQWSSFKFAIIGRIPLNVYPAGGTGLDSIAERYKIPVTEQKGGWKTIPDDSVQLIWEKARDRHAEVEALRKGK